MTLMIESGAGMWSTIFYENLPNENYQYRAVWWCYILYIFVGYFPELPTHVEGLQDDDGLFYSRKNKNNYED